MYLIRLYVLSERSDFFLSAHVMSLHRVNIYMYIVPQTPDTQVFRLNYPVIRCKVYTECLGTSDIEHGLSPCTVGNALAKARGLSLRTAHEPCYVSFSGVRETSKIVAKLKSIYQLSPRRQQLRYYRAHIKTKCSEFICKVSNEPEELH